MFGVQVYTKFDNLQGINYNDLTMITAPSFG